MTSAFVRLLSVDQRESVVVESPYARFNLRRNPFGELTRQERAELAVVDAKQWLDSLLGETAAMQFIGEKGEGKTTHLLAIERVLPNTIYVYLPEDGLQPPIPRQRPLIIDEAQRLGYLNRRRIFKLGGPLILGTHRDFTGELRRSGLHVVTVDVAEDPSPEQLARILNKRIEASRLTRSSLPHIEVSYAKRLQRQWGTNIRAIELHLYDQFQEAAQKGQSWPPLVI